MSFAKVLENNKEIMRVAVFSCSGCEKEIFSRDVIGPYKFRFFPKDLAIETTCLAEGFNTVIINSTDCLSPLVMNQLHRLQIKYIIFYNIGETPIPVEKAKALKMKMAYIPAQKEVNFEFKSDSTLVATRHNLPLTTEASAQIIETITDWKQGRKSRFELG